MFCSLEVGGEVSLDKHLQYGHGVSRQRPLLLALLLLTDRDIAELVARVQRRTEASSSIFSDSFPVAAATNDNEDVSDDENFESLIVSQLEDAEKNDVEILTLDDSDDEDIGDINVEVLLKEEDTENEEITVHEEVKQEKEESNEHSSNNDIMKINVVEKCALLNNCRLCYTKFGSEDNLRRHEQVVHVDDQQELSLKVITLDDLAHPCHLCPGVKFLTQNILNIHLKLQHNLQTKSSKTSSKSSFKCKLCYRNFTQSNYLKNHEESNHSKDKEFLERDITEDDLKFRCQECSQKFVSSHILSLHERNHKYETLQFLKKTAYNVKRKVYECCLCYSVYNKFHGLCDHVFAYHKDDLDYFKTPPQESDLRYQCPECELKFVSTNASIYHRIKTHYPVTNLGCTLCDSQYKNSVGAFSHRFKVHGKELESFSLNLNEIERQLDCDSCHQKFYTAGSLENHSMRVHYKKKSSKKKKLKRSASVNVEKDKKCHLCYASFSRNRALKEHKSTVHKNEVHLLSKELSPYDLKFCCSGCDLRFVSKISLNHHTSKSHEESYKCFFCTDILNGRQNFIDHCFNIHQKRDEFVGNNQVKCMVCSKVMKKDGLSAHRKIHTSIESHQCVLCYESFKIKSYLNVHIKTIHSSAVEREFLNDVDASKLKFNCINCDNKFLTESLLEKHVGKKHKSKSAAPPNIILKQPTYCNLCYIQFQRPGILSQHREKLHTSPAEIAAIAMAEVKHSSLKYSCTFCDKRFITKAAMRYHRQYAHKKELRKDDNCEICCEFCNKVFLWKNRKNMKAHMKSVHDVDDYDVTDFSSQTRDSNTVENFMNLLNSLK